MNEYVSEPVGDCVDECVGDCVNECTSVRMNDTHTHTHTLTHTHTTFTVMCVCVVFWRCGLNGLAHKDLANKRFFLLEFVLFYVRLLCSINFCFGPVEMRQFKNNCSGLKIDWGSPPGCSYLRNAYYIITLLFYTNVCRLGLQT